MRLPQILNKFILIIILCTFLNGCGGGASESKSAIEELTPPISRGSLTISGYVSNVAGTIVEVSASLDNQKFITSTDLEGRYELLIEEVDDTSNEMLILSASGYGDEDFIQYRSILGVYSDVKRISGSDNLLVASEEFGVNITNLTTASFGMSHIKNGNETPSSTHSVLEADLRVNAEEMLMASAAIRLAIELAQDGSDYLIPEGMSTLDLSTSTDALNNFMRAVQQSDGSIVADSKIDSITDPIAVDQQRSVGEDILFIFEPGVYPSAYEFFDDGSGRQHAGAYINEFKWSTEGNEISFDFPDRVVSSEYVYLDNDEDGKEEEYIKEIVFIGSELVFVSERDGHEIVNITDIYVSRLYDPDDPDRIQVGSDETIDWDHTWGAGRGAKAFHSSSGSTFTAPTSSEDWILPITRSILEYERDPVYTEDISVDFITIESDYSGFGDMVGEFEWEINANGNFQVLLQNSHTIEYIPFSDFIWGSIERDSDGLVWGLNIAQGGKRVSSSIDLIPGFYTLDWSWLEDYNSRFWIEVKQDGTSARVSTNDDDDDGVINTRYGEANIRTGSWSISGDSLLLDYYLSTGDRRYESCDPNVEQKCQLWNSRIWDMIAVDGDRYYMAHTHQFFDYLNDEITRYYLNSRYWIRLDEAPIEIVSEVDDGEGIINEIGFSALEGDYNRIPVENLWHEVVITEVEGTWYWLNYAGEQWPLYEEEGRLMVDSAYGIQEITIDLDEDGKVSALWFNREPYERIE